MKKRKKRKRNALPSKGNQFHKQHDARQTYVTAGCEHSLKFLQTQKSPQKASCLHLIEHNKQQPEQNRDNNADRHTARASKVHYIRMRYKYNAAKTSQRDYTELSRGSDAEKVTAHGSHRNQGGREEEEAVKASTMPKGTEQRQSKVRSYMRPCF